MSGQRVTPEAIAEALIQYETGGMCHFGQACSLCVCGMERQARRLSAHIRRMHTERTEP